MMTAEPLAQGASFIHPAFALAAPVLAGVPILIHLINRRRFRRVPWAAMGFLLAAARRSARRIRLEQILLLALRTLAVLCVAFAVARPFLASGRFVPAGQARVARVLLMDDSLSMRFADDKGVTRFTTARAAANALLDSFPDRDPVSIVTLAAPAEVVIRDSCDRRQLRVKLSRINSSESSTDVVGALQAALEILAESDTAPGNGEIYLVSDMSRRAWGVTKESAGSEAVSLANRLFARGGVHVLRCGRGNESNVALVGFAPRERLLGGAEPPRLYAEVANFGAARVRDYQLHVLRGDRIVRRVDLPALEPGAVKRLTFSIPAGVFNAHTTLRLTGAAPLQHSRLPESHTSPWPLEVRLHPPGGDALDLDDRRRLAVTVADTLPLLVVEGRRGAGRLGGDAGFLVTAMSPRTDDDEATLLAPRRIAPPDLPDEALDEYRMVVLCNVDRLTPPAWARVEEYVRRGGGLLVTAGEALDASNYNSHGYRGGEGVLPARLLEIAGEVGERAVRFATPEPGNELMGVFAGAAGASLFRARIERYLPIEEDERVGEVLARFDDGAPAIIARSFGRGRSGMLTTAVDMTWSNLPAKGDFVSLTQRLVGTLARVPGNSSNVLVGQAYQRLLSPAEAVQPMTVTDPEGRTLPAQVKRAGDQHLMLCRGLSRAGFYRAGAAGNEELVAVNVDPAESDPACLDRAALERLLVGEFTYNDDPGSIADDAAGGAVSELAFLLVHAGMLLLACETWAAMRFGAGR